jgi:hypothetical protein
MVLIIVAVIVMGVSIGIGDVTYGTGLDTLVFIIAYGIWIILAVTGLIVSWRWFGARQKPPNSN